MRSVAPPSVDEELDKGFRIIDEALAELSLDREH